MQQAGRAALATIRDLIYIYDSECRLIYANQAFLDLFNATSDDLIGKPLRDFVGDDEVADQVERDIRHIAETGESLHSSVQFTSPAGNSGYFEYIFLPHWHEGDLWVVGSTRDISERIHLSEEVSRTSERMQEILESISDAFFAVDTEWRITYLNQRASEVLMRDRDELLGQPLWDEFPEAVDTLAYQEYHLAMSEQRPRSFEFYYPPLTTWFEVNAYPTPETLSVYFRDITERVRIQQELEASERRYRTLTNAMPQMVWLTDANGYHLYYNARWYEFTGLSEEESLGFGFTNALHPDDKTRTLKRWEQAWRYGAGYEIEYRFYSRELDDYRWFLGRAFPITDARGDIVEWVGTCTDIEPQKRAEARLQESERRLADAQRIARIGNWEWDLATGVFTRSDEHDRIFGFDPARHTVDLLSYVEAIHPDDRALVREQRDRIIEAGSGSYDVEYRIFRPDGEERVLHTLAELVTDEAGNPARIIGTVHDVTERKEIEEALEDYARQQSLLSREFQQLNSTLEQQVETRTSELRKLSENLERMVWERTAELEESRAALAHQAQHDSLTDLPNRLLFEDRLDHAIAAAERNGKKVAVLFIDLDGFKLVNDTFGHAAGDGVLRTIGTRLQSRIRRYDTLARHGGDEFVAIIEGMDSAEDVLPIAQGLLSAAHEPIYVESRQIWLSVSIGVAIYPQDAQTVVGLQRLADLAMYRAKQSGKNDIRFYSPAMNAAAEERLEIASHLSTALDDGELQVHFQPQWGAISGRIERFEALLRWNSPALGSVAPARLIPIAEETGLMTAIGNWVLELSCQQAAAWYRQTGERIGIAVNVSSSQLDRIDFVDVVSAALDRHHMVPSQLELELTENLVMNDFERAIERMARLRELGVRIAMDDFGLGSSSLSNLVRLPLDTVKIDRAFVRDLPESSAADRVVQAIVSLTSGIGLDVVAEGVESAAQRARVSELGCERLQGFLLGYPVDAEATAKLLQKHLVAPPGDA